MRAAMMLGAIPNPINSSILAVSRASMHPGVMTASAAAGAFFPHQADTPGLWHLSVDGTPAPPGSATPHPARAFHAEN
jgi:hypothetical protein